MKNKKSRNNGFSLVELIVVILIIAVLAIALSIAITRYVPKSQESVCQHNISTLDTLIDIQIADDSAHGITYASDEAQREAMQRLINDQDTSCPSGGNYEVTSDFSVNCTIHGDGSNGNNVTASASLGDSEVMSQILKILSEYNASRIDSTASQFPGSNAEKCAIALSEAGIDMNALDAVSWYYNKSDNLFFFTPEDITEKSVNDKTYVIRYNGKTGTYTVWQASISTGNNSNANGVAYNVLSIENSYIPNTNLDKEQQTYEQALKDYESAMASLQ